jgi:hypothetical protein
MTVDWATSSSIGRDVGIVREARHRCARQTPQLRTWICVRCRPGRYGALARHREPSRPPPRLVTRVRRSLQRIGLAEYSTGEGDALATPCMLTLVRGECQQTTGVGQPGCSRFIYGPLAGNRAGGNGKRARPFGAHRMCPRQRRSAAPAAQSNPASISNACCRLTSAARPRASRLWQAQRQARGTQLQSVNAVVHHVTLCLIDWLTRGIASVEPQSTTRCGG